MTTWTPVEPVHRLKSIECALKQATTCSHGSEERHIDRRKIYPAEWLFFCDIRMTVTDRAALQGSVLKYAFIHPIV